MTTSMKYYCPVSFISPEPCFFNCCSQTNKRIFPILIFLPDLRSHGQHSEVIWLKIALPPLSQGNTGSTCFITVTGGNRILFKGFECCLFSVDEETRHLSEEWLSPTHRVTKTLLLKENAYRLIPSFLLPDPHWMREVHVHTDTLLINVTLTTESLLSR